MAASLSERVFGASVRPRPKETIAELLQRLRKPDDDNRVIVASPDDTAADAYKLFRTYDLHHLPVVREGRVVGIVSATDLLDFYGSLPETSPEQTPLAQLMTPDPTTVSKDTPIAEAVSILAHAQFRCLPVLNTAGDLWDIVTTRDMVQLLDLFMNRAH